MKIVEDLTRGDKTYRALTVVREADYLDEVTRERAAKAAAANVRAAEVARSGASAVQAAVETSRAAAMRATWLRPPGLLREHDRETGVAVQAPVVTEVGESPVVPTRRLGHDSGAKIGKGSLKSKGRDNGFVARAIDPHVQFYGEISEKTNGLIRTVGGSRSSAIPRSWKPSWRRRGQMRHR